MFHVKIIFCILLIGLSLSDSKKYLTNIKLIFTKIICRDLYGTDLKKSGKALTKEEKVAFVNRIVSGQGNMDSCFVLNFGFDEQLPWPQVRKQTTNLAMT